MQWLSQHADAVSTIAIIGGFLWWVKSHLDKKFDYRCDSIEKKIDEIQKDVKSIDQRLTKLEGRFEERGYWESRIVIRKEDRQPETIQAVPIEHKKRRSRKPPINTST